MRLLLLLLFCAVAAVSATTDCGRHCYSADIEFEAAPASYSIGYVPCTDTVDGHINQEAVSAYECDSLADDVLQLTFASATYTLSWRYNTTAGCDAIYDGASFGTFLNATFGDGAELLQSDSVSLETVTTSCGSDCAERCYNIPLVANDGLAGSSSPCGPENATSCNVRLQFTVVPCTGHLTAFDVLLGADATPLSVFDPAALASAQFHCLEDGQLQLDAAGVYVLWAPTSLPCSTLMSDLNTDATGGVEMFVVSAGDEEWSGTAAQGATTSLALTVCQTVGDDSQNVTDDAVPDYVHLRRNHKRVRPFVTCSHQIQQDLCCTVFGYHNPNTHTVYTLRKRNSNWITPGPADRSQRRIFNPQTQTDESFSVIWPCNKHEEHVLTWSLVHPAGEPYSSSDEDEYDEAEDLWWQANPPQREWFTQARAVRTRNDCSASQREEWCGVV